MSLFSGLQRKTGNAPGTYESTLCAIRQNVEKRVSGKSNPEDHTDDKGFRTQQEHPNGHSAEPVIFKYAAFPNQSVLKQKDSHKSEGSGREPRAIRMRMRMKKQA